MVAEANIVAGFNKRDNMKSGRVGNRKLQKWNQYPRAWTCCRRYTTHSLVYAAQNLQSIGRRLTYRLVAGIDDAGFMGKQ